MPEGTPSAASLIQSPAGRRDFLSTVRKALGHAQTSTVPPQRPPRMESVIRQVLADDPGRISRWMRLAAQNGMLVQRTDIHGVPAAVKGCFTGHVVRNVMLNFSTWPQAAIASSLSDAGLSVHHWTEPDCSKRVFDCDAAVTDCRYGLADTGAIMVWSDAGFGRSTTLTVPLHVVILSAETIIADMIDAIALLQRDTGGRMPSNVVVVNGPSKTSDIEMNLVTGVHGPKFLSVIVVDS